MSELFALCGTGLCAVFAISVIKEMHSGFVKLIVLAFSVLCIALIIPHVHNTVGFINEIASRGISQHVGVILKALGITYLCSTASEICHSVGESTVGEHIETVGKIEILALTLPLFRNLLEMTLL